MIILFLVFTSISDIKINAQIDNENKVEYKEITTGEIIDYDFFNTIINFLPKHANYNKNTTKVVYISFGILKHTEGCSHDIVTGIENKDDFTKTYYTLILVYDALMYLQTDVYYIEYGNFLFLIPKIADGVLVKKGCRKVLPEPSCPMLLPYMEDYQIIKFNKNKAEEVEYLGEEFRKAFY